MSPKLLRASRSLPGWSSSSQGVKPHSCSGCGSRIYGASAERLVSASSSWVSIPSMRWPRCPPKTRSMSSERTFEADVTDRAVIESTLLGMAEELVARMYSDSVQSSCAMLKLRYDDFETLSARRTRQAPFIGSAGVYEAAVALLDEKWMGRPIRLIGLGLAIDKRAGQGGLFDDPGERDARVERAVIEAAKRGLGKMTRARLVPRPASPEVIPKKPS